MARSTVGALLRTSQAFYSQLCDKQTLEHGIAYYSRRFAGLAEANQFREVVVEDAARIPPAFEEAERWFQQQGLFCRRWAPADGTASDELRSFLVSLGFAPRTLAALALTGWIDLRGGADVRVLQARAMREAFRQTFVDADSPPSPAMRRLLADAYEERLDDPQFDAFVALVDGRAAGRCALYQVGDISRLMDLCVLAPYADRGVDAALAAHALALAKRLAARTICLGIPTEDAGRRDWFHRVGFVEDGTVVEFEREGPGDAGDGP